MAETIERLFFALWPTQQIRHELTDVFAGVSELAGQGRMMVPSNLHMTLHFLGNIPSYRVNCFLQRAQQIILPSFELKINKLDYFERPKVSWLGASDNPPALFQLQSLLGEKIKLCGFEPEERPFRPHITMARKVKQSVIINPLNTIRWKVDKFVLVKSIVHKAEVKYRVKASFPLQRSQPIGMIL